MMITIEIGKPYSASYSRRKCVLESEGQVTSFVAWDLFAPAPTIRCGMAVSVRIHLLFILLLI